LGRIHWLTNHYRNGKPIFNGYSFQYYSTYWQYTFNRVLRSGAYSQHSQDFNIGKVIDMGTVQPKAVLDAYDAPFPSEEYKAGARIFLRWFLLTTILNQLKY
jgi:hypothetical protein